MTVGHRPRVGRAFRRIALLGATALLFALLPGGVAFAEHFENTEVLDADNAVEAAVNWSQFTFDSATDVALGRNDKFPDNLASSVIQGTDTPLLYTDGDALSEETAAELDRLGAETIHVLGGEEAISEDVVDELEALGYETHRDAGETRIETALDIAATHAADATHGLVVRAFGDAQGDETRAWADALAAGGWAAEEGWPVFLTQTEELNDNVRAYLEDSAIESLTIIGGVNAVSAAVQAELEAMGIEVDRVSGSNRFATAVAIAEARGFADAGDTDEVILSEGQQSDAWAGGFAAAAYSAISGAPIVLSNGETIPPETRAFLEGAGADGTVALVCGPFVEPAACAEAAEILGHEHAAHTNQSFTGTPQETAVNTVSDNAATSTQNRGQRQYTFTGLDNTKTYNVALIPSEEVDTDEDGTVTFRDNNVGLPNNADNLCNTTAFIEVVNGASTAGNDDCVNDVTPQNGTITVSIDSTTGESVVPVVFQDADNDNQLDLAVPATANTDPKQPSEDFGVGGQKTWVPVEAASGAIAGGNDVAVTSVDKDLNYIVANGLTYYYDANDVFQIATSAVATGNGDNPTTCTNTTLANFEQQLSQADELDRSTNYTQDEAAASTFCLEDIAPSQPQTVVATPQDADTIRVTWTAPTTGAPSSYRIYRMQTTNACPEGQTNLSQYTQVAEVSGSTTQYDDNGLAAATRYCYVVTAVQNGDESAPSTSANGTTTEAGSTVQPQSTDAYIETDTSFPGFVSGGDVWRVIFDKQMQPVTDGDTVIVQDAQGDSLTVICDAAPAGAVVGENADCDFNTTNVTVAGTAYGPGRVLTVTLQGGTIIAATSTPTGTMNDQLEYPVTITTQNGFTDLNNNPWTPADDPDRVIDNEGSKTFTTATDPNTTDTGGGGAAPEMTGTAGLTATTVAVNYDEAVVPFGSAYNPAQFRIDQDGDCNLLTGVVVNATAVTQTDADTLTITFPTGQATATDCLVYDDDIAAYPEAGDVVDTVGNQQPDLDNVVIA